MFFLKINIASYEYLIITYVVTSPIQLRTWRKLCHNEYLYNKIAEILNTYNNRNKYMAEINPEESMNE